MSADLIPVAAQLGVAAFAIMVMWWMYKSAADERQRNDARLDTDRKSYLERMDRKDEAFRTLEEQVRTEITVQLATSTSALHENSRVMERVIDKMTRT